MSSEFWFGSSGAAAGGGGVPPDRIGGSVRFRGLPSGIYRSAAPPNTGDNKVWTLSVWVKHGDQPNSGQGVIWGSAPASTLYGRVEFRGNGDLTYVNNHSSGGGHVWTAKPGSVKLTDPTAWYHIVLQQDATNATAANRIKWWINGESIANSGNQPGQNIGGLLLSSYQDGIGLGYAAFQSWNARHYQAEMHVCQEQLYGPEIFGERDGNGIWVPKDPSEISVTYGAKGFYLPFAAGNVQNNAGGGSSFTTRGIEQSATTSTDYDCSPDSPTNNHANWNQAKYGMDRLNEANAKAKTGNKNAPYFGTANLTFGVPSSGKWYWEYTYVSGVGSFGLGLAFPPNEDADQIAAYAPGTGWIYIDGAANQSGLGGSSGDVLGYALDMDAKQMRFYRNNTLIATKTFTSNGPFAIKAMHVSGSGSDDIWYNQNLRYSPPAGYAPLNTESLPAPSLPNTITGTFVGNNNANGPYVYTGCTPGRIQYGSVDVTYGNRLSQSNVDFLANGFKVRSTTSNSGNVNWTVTTTHSDGIHNGNKVPFGGRGVSPATAVFN